MRKLAILVFISFIYHSIAIYGQNLVSGNPSLSYTEQNCLSDKELEFSLTYLNTYSGQYYKEDQLYNGFKTIKNANINYAEFKSAFGFTSKISASAELGYFFNKTINFQDSSQKGYGLGDAALIVKYRLIYSKNAKFTLLPSIGIKIPLGVFDQKSENINLPVSIQPSSGNYKYIAGIYMSKVMNEKLSISSVCTYEYAQLIDSDNFFYKYGDKWMLSFYAKYNFSEKFSTNLQFRFETKDKSHIAINKVVENSGYKIIYVSPQINYNFNNNWQLSTYFDLPFYRYYNGIQLTSGFTMSIKILRKFDLKF